MLKSRHVCVVLLACLVGCAAEGPSETVWKSGETLSTSNEDGVFLDGRKGPVSTGDRHVTSRIVSDAEHAEYAKHKPQLAVTGRQTTPPPSSTDVVIADATTRAPDDIITIVARLTDVPFDFSRMEGASDVARSSLVNERIAGLKDSQDRFEAALAQISPISVTRMWLANQVILKVRAKHVAALAKLSDVVELIPDGPTHPLAYSGVETRSGTLAANFHSANVRGGIGNRIGGPIRVGVIATNYFGDPDNPLSHHVGFGDRAGDIYDCRYLGTCLTATWGPNGQWTHDTSVSGVLLGSIENGEDTYHSFTPTEKAQRSGMAPYALLYYYKIDTCSSVAVALQHAVADGVDVVNFSATCDPTQVCNAGANVGGLNAALASSLNSGVVTVVAAGNDGSNYTGCSVNYPALRPEVVSVGGLNTTGTPDYGTTDRHSGSSRGPLPITLFTGSARETNGIDLMAPGTMTDFYTEAPANYYSTAIFGTSFSAPIVAGGAALIQNAFLLDFGVVVSGQFLLVNTLLMGDGTNLDGSNVEMLSGFSAYSGAGRLRLHRPADLTYPSGWGWVKRPISHHQEICGPVGSDAAESYSITEWKWVGTWFESNLNSAADIDFYVYNDCLLGSRQYVASDAGYNLRGRIRLSGAEIGGRCLRQCVYGYNVPAGQTRDVYSADYYHSGSPLTH